MSLYLLKEYPLYIQCDCGLVDHDSNTKGEGGGVSLFLCHVFDGGQKEDENAVKKRNKKRKRSRGALCTVWYAVPGFVAFLKW